MTISARLAIEVGDICRQRIVGEDDGPLINGQKMFGKAVPNATSGDGRGR